MTHSTAAPPPVPQSELESFLVEITASIFKKKDEMGEGFLIDKVQDKTGMKVCGSLQLSGMQLPAWQQAGANKARAEWQRRAG